MKYILSLLIGALLSAAANGQQKEPFKKAEKCRSNALLHQNLNLDPSLRLQRAKILEESKRWILEQQQITIQKSPAVVVNIPTVVHVVYANATQNISDAQIQSQLQVLNEDFSRSNTDFSWVVPTEFQVLAADIEFNFCLAQIDPNGNNSIGITRTMTTVANIGNSNSPAIFYSNNGGKDSWDDSRYLNIYVCEIDDNGQILGYATLPGSAISGEDGIVVDYKYFGTIGTVTAPLDKGRTATHEVGHYFNLDHIWGNGCSTDDDVADTPEQENSYGGCPVHPRSSCGTNDMFMNFMDYVNDNCMAFFTEGQKTRMRAAINTARIGLLNNSAACGTAANELLVQADNWQLFPNPTDKSTITLSYASSKPVEARVVLRDMQGNMLVSRQLYKELRLNVSMLAAGIYTIEIIREKSISVKKLILR